jgi:hypothetical protein
MKKSACLPRLVWIGILAFGVRGACGEEAGAPFGEIGKTPFSENIEIRLETNNDSYSILSNGDWDDLRSFGSYFGISARRWRLEVTLDGLTNRADTVAQSGRIDQGSVIVSKNVPVFENGRFSASTALGGGVWYVGKLGLKGVQDLAHNGYGDSREIPERYDRAGANLSGVAVALFAATFEMDRLTLSFFSTGEVLTNGFLRSGNYLDAGAGDGFLGIDFWCGYVAERNGAVEGETFKKTVESEQGLSVGAKFRSGVLQVGFSRNVNTGRQAGYAALTTYPEAKQRTGSTGDNGTIQAIDIQLAPLLASVRLRTRLAGRAVILGGVLGAESGPGYYSPYANRHVRFELAYAGPDITFVAFPWCEVYALAAGGVQKEQLLTREAIAATVISERSFVTGFGEAGIRIFPFSGQRSAGEYGLVVAGRAERVQIPQSVMVITLHVSISAATGR